MKPRVLLLFDYDWDAEGLAALRQHYDFDRAGFDLFEFPDNARLINFDLDRFVSKLLKQHQKRPYDVVLSNHEQFGALAAALFAQKAGLVGPSPQSIVACQHKLWMRAQLEQACPQANIRFAPLDCDIGSNPPHVEGFPHFAKPIKAAYSVLARLCKDQADLIELTHFSWHEKWVIRRLVEPFDRIRRQLLPLAPSAHRMLLEEPIRGAQFNLDGYMRHGKAHLLGVVDELMYPGTQAFLRFHYPSQLSASQQAHALEIAERFLNYVGFDNSFFNMEFFYDQTNSQIKIIEFNPRLGSQLADLYTRVDGRNIFLMQLALARGLDPLIVERQSTNQTCAASFVFRRFDGADAPPPLSPSTREAFKKSFPNALLFEFRKSAVGLAREYKWLGSHRYGIVHLSGKHEADLQNQFEAATQLLGWSCPEQYRAA
jgi:ATP-grasp domain